MKKSIMRKINEADAWGSSLKINGIDIYGSVRNLGKDDNSTNNVTMGNGSHDMGTQDNAGG